MIVSAQKAAELIREGQVVAIPTETVYGLAADATNIQAVRHIFELKGRPPDNPLIVHVAEINQVASFTDDRPDILFKLIDRFWPGPLTFVLSKKASVLDIITAGLDTVALRMPDHPKALSVIKKTGPVAAPSANRSGRPSPTRPEHITLDFGDDLPVIDGGPCSIGLESTVLDLSGYIPTILRPGKITADQIEDMLDIKVLREPAGENQIRRSPGTRYSHYKPNASVSWMSSIESIRSYQPDTLYIFHTQSPKITDDNIITFEGNYLDFAKSLYDLYRTADKRNYKKIFIEPLPDTTLSPIIPALLNRIQRSVSH
ncbi:L-threonylcarbamoyladenylate synthase [Rhodohalobacter sp. 8-1]|uniref:L-threonylcarbamoyladenylate synthase n=1 Tax=Rhodohalobacter sp. 8-1 TaxID=3131972 RepID=UPI0030ECDDED